MKKFRISRKLKKKIKLQLYKGFIKAFKNIGEPIAKKWEIL
jgi:hypothetical protein